MALGKNLPSDKLIRKTSKRKQSTSKSKQNTSSKDKNVPSGVGVTNPRRKQYPTHNTKKMTFYIHTGLLQRLYNFAYWDHLNVTEAFNKVLEDGLKGKNTKSV